MREQKNRQLCVRRRLACAVALLVLIPLGLLCRFAPLGLSYLIVKYGGSFLWAAAVYWCIAFFSTRQRRAVVACVAIVLTATVEFIKRIHSSTLDIFRNTFAGKVLLGRHFSYFDIAIYWIAVLCAMLVDRCAIQD
jgi:Protein of unknown function (DUF2809)